MEEMRLSEVLVEENNLFEQLIEKVNSVKWTNKILKMEDSDHQYLSFEVPKEREFETLRIGSTNRALAIILKTNVQDYRFIKGFEAIWSAMHRRIECEIDVEAFFPSYRMLELIKRVTTNESNDAQERCGEGTPDVIVERVGNITLASLEEVTISVGIGSEEFRILSGLKTQLASIDINRPYRKITIQIENIKINTHADAQKYLLKISNSLLFQLNQLLPIAISLSAEKENRLMRLQKRRSNPICVSKLVALKHEYDNEPMALYLHAKKSIDSPLNQFLGFYQSIEYYFSAYANIEAKQQIQRILKNPLFNPNIDTDITQILSAIKVTRSNEIGDERNQLDITIRSCVDQEILKEFIISDEKRKDFYKNNLGKKLSSQSINIVSRNTNLIHEIAERIYDIRCRIVHKKANDNHDGLILPYSSEVRLLKIDTEIIEFISRNVLIENSRPLHL